METKITIRKSKTAKTGYEVLNGDNKVLPIENTYPGEPFTLVLPANTANRKYFNSKKVDAANGSIQVEYKATKTLGPRDSQSRSPVKKAAEYLPEEERKQLEALLEKAAKLKAEQKAAPLTELEKALRAKERAEAKVAALMAAQPIVIDDQLQEELDAEVARQKAAK